MTESSIVRGNLMTQEGYVLYCGNPLPRKHEGGCDNPRTTFSQEKHQFICPHCNWVS